MTADGRRMSSLKNLPFGGLVVGIYQTLVVVKMQVCSNQVHLVGPPPEEHSCLNDCFPHLPKKDYEKKRTRGIKSATSAATKTKTTDEPYLITETTLTVFYCQFPKRETTLFSELDS